MATKNPNTTGRSWSSVAKASAPQPTPAAAHSAPTPAQSHPHPTTSQPPALEHVSIVKLKELVKNSKHEEKLAHRSAFRHLMTSMNGKEVTIETRDKAIVSGILSTMTLYEGSHKKEVVLKAAKLLEGVTNKPFTPGATLLIPYSEIIRINAKLGELTPRPRKKELQTDSDLAKTDKKNLYGRELQMVANNWLDPTTNADLNAFEKNETWDQFETNRKKFNVKSTYDENIYTKPLEQDISPERLARAERLAREIENSSTSNIHLLQERGQIDLQEVDEEAMFSGVIRDDYQSNFIAKKEAPKDENPWKRGLKLNEQQQAKPAANQASRAPATANKPANQRQAAPVASAWQQKPNIAAQKPVVETPSATEVVPPTPAPGLVQIPAAAPVAIPPPVSEVPAAAVVAPAPAAEATTGETKSSGFKFNLDAKEFKFNLSAKEFVPTFTFTPPVEFTPAAPVFTAPIPPAPVMNVTPAVPAVVPPVAPAVIKSPATQPLTQPHENVYLHAHPQAELPPSGHIPTQPTLMPAHVQGHNPQYSHAILTQPMPTAQVMYSGSPSVAPLVANQQLNVQAMPPQAYIQADPNMATYVDAYGNPYAYNPYAQPYYYSPVVYDTQMQYAAPAATPYQPMNNNRQNKPRTNNYNNNYNNNANNVNPANPTNPQHKRNYNNNGYSNNGYNNNQGGTSNYRQNNNYGEHRPHRNNYNNQHNSYHHNSNNNQQPHYQSYNNQQIPSQDFPPVQDVNQSLPEYSNAPVTGESNEDPAAYSQENQ